MKFSVGSCVLGHGGGGPALSNSMSSTASELVALVVGEKLTIARRMRALDTVTSKGVRISCGLALGLNAAVTCPICVPLASNTRSSTVVLTLNGVERPTHTLTRRWAAVKLISIGALQNSWA